MSTKVSSIYDALVSTCVAQLTNYAKIPNAYDVNANSTLFLKSGFAVGYGPASNSERLINCQYSVIRTFSIILIGQLTASLTDFDGFKAVTQTLFEDQAKIKKVIEGSPQVGGTGTFTKWISDGGLEFLETDSTKYFLIESIFESEYFETLS